MAVLCKDVNEAWAKRRFGKDLWKTGEIYGTVVGEQQKHPKYVLVHFRDINETGVTRKVKRMVYFHSKKLSEFPNNDSNNIDENKSQKEENFGSNDEIHIPKAI